MRTIALRFACLGAALAAQGILAGPMTQPHEVDGVEVTVLEAKRGLHNNYTVIGPKKKMTLWAKFEAPPADVTKIELHLPGASLPFEGVPVTP